ncbi:tetratricopeptide repeat protein [Aquisphaera insulae]|uniref:tetratricopeptide repeat-containing glycosyltransferase family protein n=1 Tax=Aquisphaera insulae TaxID=2712864 RepID=UPI0013E9F3D4|nr:tetratricopeptide repeat-containing glycosyltransferase family protein [Aquisphaera insulae]
MIAQDPLAMAGACLHAGDYLGAERASRLAVDRNPWIPDGWFILAVASQLLGKLAESVEHYRKVLGLVPYNAEAWNNLGASLLSLRRPEEAEPCIIQALRLDPRYEQAHNNLGNALQATGRLAEAEACYRRAIELNPRYVGAREHLGLVLQSQGRLDEAIAAYEEALTLAPTNADIAMNRAYTLLQKGDFVRGWEAYEARWGCPEHIQAELPLPLWDGRPLGGKTVLLRAEQGLGDVIQFLRFAPMIRERDGRVAVCCPRTLLALAATCPGVSRVYTDDKPPVDPEIVCQAAIMSLPYLLGITLETIPATVPYLHPDPSLVADWSEKLRPEIGLKVGVVWQGNPDHKKDYLRSFRLSRFEPLAGIPGVRLYSLQKNVGADQLEEMKGRFPIRDLGRDCASFMDTAAAIANLDLVIAPDTAVAHLASALGKPAWVVLPFAAEWRWLMDRQDTPWYPSMRLFRQPRWGDWDSVFRSVASELASMANPVPGPRP